MFFKFWKNSTFDFLHEKKSSIFVLFKLKKIKNKDTFFNITFR